MLAAILTSGRIAAGAEAGNSLKDSLRELNKAMFPEQEDDMIDKARKNLKILQSEYERGPMKVQPLNYSKRGKKKR